MHWDWAYTWRIMPELMAGFRVTVLATISGMVIAIVIGLVLAMLRRSPRRWISWPTGGLIEFVRSTPLLIQIYFLYYVLPQIHPGFGDRMTPFATGVIALGLHYSAYTSEVYRAGIEAVPRGQWEAARALNLGERRKWLGIIIPQAVPPVVPALGNYLVAMFKDTPLLAAITVLEVLNRAKDIGSESFRYLEPITIVGVLFLLVSLISAALIRLVEHHVRLPEKR